jgi:hypothetical protein
MSKSSDGLAATRLPKGNLSLAHLGEASRGKSVVLAQPDCSAVLGARVARRLMHRLLLADIPHSDLLISRRRHEKVTARIPGQALHDVGVLEGQVVLAGTNIPKLDCEVARGRSEDVFGGGVEQDLPDFSIVNALVCFEICKRKKKRKENRKKEVC